MVLHERMCLYMHRIMCLPFHEAGAKLQLLLLLLSFSCIGKKAAQSGQDTVSQYEEDS